DAASRAQQIGFVLPFLSARSDGTLFGVFRRNIVVTDSDLIEENKAEGGDKRLKLRGRDLRYAKLDRTDMRGADLTGAALDGASLVGANLEDAWLTCAEMDRLLLANDRAAANCASAHNVDLTRAQLANAHRSEEHTSELQSPDHLVCRLLLEKKNGRRGVPSLAPSSSPITSTGTVRLSLDS